MLCECIKYANDRTQMSQLFFVYFVWINITDFTILGFVCYSCSIELPSSTFLTPNTYDTVKWAHISQNNKWSVGYIFQQCQSRPSIQRSYFHISFYFYLSYCASTHFRYIYFWPVIFCSSSARTGLLFQIIQVWLSILEWNQSNYRWLFISYNFWTKPAG